MKEMQDKGWIDRVAYSVKWSSGAMDKVRAMTTEQQREFVENYKPSRVKGLSDAK